MSPSPLSILLSLTELEALGLMTTLKIAALIPTITPTKWFPLWKSARGVRLNLTLSPTTKRMLSAMVHLLYEMVGCNKTIPVKKMGARNKVPAPMLLFNLPHQTTESCQGYAPLKGKAEDYILCPFLITLFEQLGRQPLVLLGVNRLRGVSRSFDEVAVNTDW